MWRLGQKRPSLIFMDFNIWTSTLVTFANHPGRFLSLKTVIILKNVTEGDTYEGSSDILR